MVLESRTEFIVVGVMVSRRTPTVSWIERQAIEYCPNVKEWVKKKKKFNFRLHQGPYYFGMDLTVIKLDYFVILFRGPQSFFLFYFTNYFNLFNLYT